MNSCYHALKSIGLCFDNHSFSFHSFSLYKRVVSNLTNMSLSVQRTWSCHLMSKDTLNYNLVLRTVKVK